VKQVVEHPSWIKNEYIYIYIYIKHSETIRLESGMKVGHLWSFAQLMDPKFAPSPEGAHWEFLNNLLILELLQISYSTWIKLTILHKWSYWSLPHPCWLLNLKYLTNIEHVVQPLVQWNIFLVFILRSYVYIYIWQFLDG
jgi:hypothetical protein